jgi:Protein of unknown function (DUF1286)
VVVGLLKAITHLLFSVGLGLSLLYRVEGPTPLYLALTVWLAFATNQVIDVLGHFNKGGMPARSFWTHSVFTAPLWGIAVALVTVYFLDRIVGLGMPASQAVLLYALGVVIAYSHLLLDALTEGGVFLGRRRVALAHFRYNNPVLNAAFAALGVLLVFAVLI